MKTKLSLILGGLLLLSQAAMAQTTTYSVSATVPAGAGVGITVNSVNTATSSFTLVPGTTLNYAPLSFNTTNNVYLANNYFTFDVAVIGAGAPNTIVAYTAGIVPAGAVNTLGSNSSISFDKEVYTSSSTPPTQTPYSGPFVLSSLAGTPQTVPYTAVTGGWTRIYMGLCTGNTSSAAGTVDPAGCHPFSSADAVGTYTGTLSITTAVN